MVYQGSKQRISSQILPIMLANRTKGQYFIEPFVGGANTLSQVSDPRIGVDINKYLIAMWKDLQAGREFPQNVTKELYVVHREYKKYDNSPDLGLTGHIGFAASYGAKFFGGYAGIITSKSGTVRNYPQERHKNLYAQKQSIMNIEFINADYRYVTYPDNSIIYCDIPYRGATKYSTKLLDYEEFYSWCKRMTRKGHTVFVSEYAMPEGFTEVWSKSLNVGLNNNHKRKVAVERLFLCEDSNASTKIAT